MVNTVESASYKSVEKPPSAVVNTQACETLLRRLHAPQLYSVLTSDILYTLLMSTRDNVMEEGPL